MGLGKTEDDAMSINWYNLHPLTTNRKKAREWMQRATCEIETLREEAKTLKAQLANAKAENLWCQPNRLQTDSYATGRQMVEAILSGRFVEIEVTDGGYTWKGKFPLPPDFNK